MTSSTKVHSSSPSHPRPQEKEKERTYTVKKGDTLTHIAKKHDVELGEVVKANPQIKDPELIHPGQVVNIPESKRTDTKPRVCPAAEEITRPSVSTYSSSRNEPPPLTDRPSGEKAPTPPADPAAASQLNDRMQPQHMQMPRRGRRGGHACSDGSAKGQVTARRGSRAEGAVPGARDTVGRHARNQPAADAPTQPAPGESTPTSPASHTPTVADHIKDAGSAVINAAIAGGTLKRALNIGQLMRINGIGAGAEKVTQVLTAQRGEVVRTWAKAAEAIRSNPALNMGDKTSALNNLNRSTASNLAQLDRTISEAKRVNTNYGFQGALNKLNKALGVAATVATTVIETLNSPATNPGLKLANGATTGLANLQWANAVNQALTKGNPALAIASAADTFLADATLYKSAKSGIATLYSAVDGLMSGDTTALEEMNRQNLDGERGALNHLLSGYGQAFATGDTSSLQQYQEKALNGEYGILPKGFAYLGEGVNQLFNRVTGNS